MWYSYEPGGEVRIITGRTSRKGKLLERARRFSLCVQTETLPYEYVSVEGPIVVVEAADLERDRRPLARRYLGTEVGDSYIESTRDVAGNVLVRMRPERWLTVDDAERCVRSLGQVNASVRPMSACGWREILVCATVLAVRLRTLPALANIGLPMVAVFLPPAWFALIPIIIIESAYGVWRFRIAASPTCAAAATANCISILIGLPVTSVVLALGQLLLFGWLPEFSMALPLGVMTVVGAPWLGPGAEESPWVVPLASAALTVPFYTMSVVCEHLVVGRFMPDLSRHVLRSWMLGANAASYAFLLLVTLTGWMWPKTFEKMSAMAFPVTTWLVERVLHLAALLQ